MCRTGAEAKEGGGYYDANDINDPQGTAYDGGYDSRPGMTYAKPEEGEGDDAEIYQDYDSRPRTVYAKPDESGHSRPPTNAAAANTVVYTPNAEEQESPSAPPLDVYSTPKKPSNATSSPSSGQIVAAVSYVEQEPEAGGAYQEEPFASNNPFAAGEDDTAQIYQGYDDSHTGAYKPEEDDETYEPFDRNPAVPAKKGERTAKAPYKNQPAIDGVQQKEAKAPYVNQATVDAKEADDPYKNQSVVDSAQQGKSRRPKTGDYLDAPHLNQMFVAAKAAKSPYTNQSIVNSAQHTGPSMAQHIPADPAMPPLVGAQDIPEMPPLVSKAAKNSFEERLVHKGLGRSKAEAMLRDFGLVKGACFGLD